MENIRRHTDAGIDIVSDGECSKISYATYINAATPAFPSITRAPDLSER